MTRRARHYAIRYTAWGSYASLGRRCIVRTFGTEAERDAYVAAQAPRESVLYDGERRAVPASALLTEHGSGRTESITLAVPGI